VTIIFSPGWENYCFETRASAWRRGHKRKQAVEKVTKNIKLGAMT